ncbi:hypothetical protein AgCh_037206 [Apium graveolens]
MATRLRSLDAPSPKARYTFKSRSMHAYSSKACYTSKPGTKSKPNSPPQCLPFTDFNKIIKPASVTALVKIMYNDVRVHLSRFIRRVENRDFDKSDHRKKARDLSSKPSYRCDMHVHGQKARDKSLRPNFNYDVYDHQNKDADKSKPRFSNAGDKSKPLNYRCYPFSHINKCDCEDGNKIIMPKAALDAVISMRNFEYPNAFKIINPLVRKYSYCGVIDYNGEDGNVYLPKWMLNSLLLQKGQFVNFECATLPKGTLLKLQPHNTKFIMNLSNPREAMEKILKDFACVTTGDTIRVYHENKNYYLNIVEARPKKVVSLIETDCEIEFTNALDHEEPENLKQESEQFEDTTNLEKNEDNKKLVVSFRKYSKMPVCGFDSNHNNRRNRRHQVEGMRQHRRDKRKCTLLSC